MKIQIRDILVGVLALILVWQIFFSNKKEGIKPQEIMLKIPEKNGTTGIQTIERVQQIPVYIPQYKEVIQVDKKYKDLYENEKDSVKKLNLYLQAIKINELDSTIIDNDTIKIDAYTKTRGDLLEYKVDYRIKQSLFSYTPKIEYKRPSLSAGFGVQAGMPTTPNTDFIMKGDLYLQNGKGNGFSLGYDTEKRVWLGVQKTIVLKK